MSYIEREAAIEDLEDCRKEYSAIGNVDGACAMLIAKNVLSKQPTADVVEVRHGRWLYHECVSSYEGCKNGYSCSVCNAFVDEEVFDTDEFHKVFCGECGAKMDGERSENATT